MKVLVLAEKPSVGKDLARVLGCKQKHKGFIEGADFIVTWSLGHLITLAEPHDYDSKYREWHMEHLPMLPERMKLKVIKKTAFQFQTIKKIMKRADIKELVIATDAGREGELVARWIIKKARWGRPILRLWISSQTDQAIRQGFEQLKPAKTYDNLYKAAQCRAEADWLIGLNVTRALTCKFENQLSAGRVQTPTLALIINRENEINNFVPQDYWMVKAYFGNYFGMWRDKAGNYKIFDYSKAEKIRNNVQGQIGKIEQINIKQKQENPPLAYDLTELQRDANRRYGFSAQKTLKTLQKLYEQHKLVTYPRTDSRYITEDMLPTLIPRLKAIAVLPYKKFIEPLLKKKLNPGKRFVDNRKVTDHHAIIPTEQPLDLQKLNDDERAILDLVVRRFLAVLYPPYYYDQITIITVVKEECFYSQGRVVKNLGFRAILVDLAIDEGQEKENPAEQNLYHHVQGEENPLKQVKIQRAQTKPPPRYTEATLLSAMENPGRFIEDNELRESIKKGGLGTPATRAEIIEKIIRYNYVQRKGKSLIPTAKGFQLIELVPEELKVPELTAKWELRLSNITEGKENTNDFIKGIRLSASRLVQDIRMSNKTCHIIETQTRQSRYNSRKKDRFVSKKLLSQYRESGDEGVSLGDLIKAAAERKKKGESKIVWARGL